MLFFITSFTFAEVKPYIFLDIGLVNTDQENEDAFDFGVGIEFTQYFEIEAAYNDCGAIDLIGGVSISSLSIEGHLGVYVFDDNIHLYAILGSERLEAEGEIFLVVRLMNWAQNNFGVWESVSL